MSDDDDMPPPLEDMSAQISAFKEKKQAAAAPAKQSNASEHFTKVNPTSAPSKADQGVTFVAPTDGEFKKINPVKQPAADAPKQQSKNSGFGGFAAGFLNAKPPQKKAAQKENKPTVEDYTHIKAKEKAENLKFKEV